MLRHYPSGANATTGLQTSTLGLQFWLDDDAFDPMDGLLRVHCRASIPGDGGYSRQTEEAVVGRKGKEKAAGDKLNPQWITASSSAANCLSGKYNESAYIVSALSSAARIIVFNYRWCRLLLNNDIILGTLYLALLLPGLLQRLRRHLQTASYSSLKNICS